MKNVKGVKKSNVFKCEFCNDTGVAEYLSVEDIPIGVSVENGTKEWSKYSKLGSCPNGCVIKN